MLSKIMIVMMIGVPLQDLTQRGADYPFSLPYRINHVVPVLNVCSTSDGSPSRLSRASCAHMLNAADKIVEIYPETGLQLLFGEDENRQCPASTARSIGRGFIHCHGQNRNIQYQRSRLFQWAEPTVNRGSTLVSLSHMITVFAVHVAHRMMSR